MPMPLRSVPFHLTLSLLDLRRKPDIIPKSPKFAMDPHPAYIFSFATQSNGIIIVHSPYYSSMEICHKNPGLSWAGAGGVALLPATYLKACQSEVDKLNGFFILHGPERWIDGPVLLYSIYLMHAAPYFRHLRGQLSVMQFPGNILSFGLPDTSWQYMGASLRPLCQPPHIPRHRSSVRTLQGSPTQPGYGQDETIRSAQATAPSNCRTLLRSRDSHSNPPPLAADGTPRIPHVEAGLGAIESNKQLEDLKAMLAVASQLARPPCNSCSSVSPVTAGSPRLHDVDKTSNALPIIQKESLEDGPINLTKVSPEISRRSLAGQQDRGRQWRSRDLGSVSVDFSASTRRRSQQQQSLLQGARASH